MASKIILKKSSVASKAPVAGDLDFGELAINYTDSKLYFKKADGSIDAFTSAAASAPVTSVGGNIGAVTDAQLLASIKNVDGTGSGLDADFLDGLNASAFYLASNPAGYTNNIGTITEIVAGTGLTGGTITSSGTINLNDTGVTAGSYTASNITVDAQGRITSVSNGSTGSGISSINFVQFPTSGTYVPPSNLVYAEVTMVGGGGGGGGSDSGSTTSVVAAGGGSGGNGAIKLYSKASLGSSVSVVIGAAGAGGSGGPVGNGSSGGTTSFGTDSVSGGRGGNGILATNGVGFETSPTSQTPPTNSMFIAGGNGKQGIALVYSGTNYVAGGSGGNTILSVASGLGATRTGTAAGSIAGNAPPNYAPGSGGGGAVTVNTTTGAVGGSGSPGFVLIKEYLS